MHFLIVLGRTILIKFVPNLFSPRVKNIYIENWSQIEKKVGEKRAKNRKSFLVNTQKPENLNDFRNMRFSKF